MFARRKAALPPDADPRPYLLRLLTGRDYSRAQLESKLRSRGYAEERIQEALATLVEQKLFREEAFVVGRVRALINRGYGPSHIRARLRQERTQVSDADIAAGYDALGTSPEEQVRELVRKALKFSTRMKGSPDEAARRKIVQAVAAKGHALSLVIQEVKRQSAR